MKDGDAPENRLCTGHRAGRPVIEINCPKCEATFDTEARQWIDCPECGAYFNRRTGSVLSDIIEEETK